jgi:hypothetical protein
VRWGYKMLERDIKAIQTKYNGYHFRSRLEARWAVFFDTLGIKYLYENEGYDLGELGWYLPDFEIKAFGDRDMAVARSVEELEEIVAEYEKIKRTASFDEMEALHEKGWDNIKIIKPNYDWFVEVKGDTNDVVGLKKAKYLDKHCANLNIQKWGCLIFGELNYIDVIDDQWSDNTFQILGVDPNDWDKAITVARSYRF